MTLLPLIVRVVEFDPRGRACLGLEFEVNDRGVERGDAHTRILPIEIEWNESRESLERLVDLVEFGLHALEFIGVLADLFFHNLS